MEEVILMTAGKIMAARYNAGELQPSPRLDRAELLDLLETHGLL